MDKFTVALHAVLHKEAEGGYSISCPELNVHTQGETKKEAWDNLKEAVACALAARRRCG